MPFCKRVAVNFRVRNRADIFVKQFGESRFFFLQIFNSLCKEPLRTGAQTSQPGNIQCARFQCGRHLRRVMLQKALYAAAAYDQRAESKPGAHIDAACSLRAEKGFVPGKTQHIDPHRLHIDGLCSRRLGCIHDQKHPIPVSGPRCLCKIRLVSGDVGCHGQDECAGVRPEILIPLRIAEPAFRICFDEIQPCALLPQTIQRPQNRVVFADRCDDVIARPEQTADSQIERLRGVRSKSNAGRIRHIQQLCHCTACLKNDS